ncbi:hypothetical protein PPERSA_00159 [Pseudocohnilembus persalinus]|uniref:Uncharacterized protein n=1 Tax=Pseudocohnilembus persalinus TaxID=266149 RepID=A0A0V0QI26_PSEPJ|nr:hypothetical protein PPERSA_00159 [Pseudocohnilembus persalinus]|eukprot:KRX01786.1 hypothetical protein PPERSA_00159 [Pseudocohnilembus persalinus]
MNQNNIESKKGEENQNKELEEIHKLSQPLWISKLITKRPCLFFWVSFLLIIILVETTEFDQQSVNQNDFQTFIIYKKNNKESLLTVENVKKMQKIEKQLTTQRDNEWEKICHIKNGGKICDSFYSIPLLIDSSSGYDSEITQEKIDNFINYITSSQSIFDTAKLLFDKNFSMENKEIQYARSIYNFGFPFEGFDNYTDEDEKQADQFKEWNFDFYDFIDEGQDTDGMEVTYFNNKGREDYENRQIKSDILFAFFAHSI